MEASVHLHALAAELKWGAPSTPNILVILGMPYTQAGCFGKDNILMLLGISHQSWVIQHVALSQC